MPALFGSENNIWVIIAILIILGLFCNNNSGIFGSENNICMIIVIIAIIVLFCNNDCGSNKC